LSKLYKTVYTIEVLSDEPLGEVSLADIQYEITEGHCSGVFREKSCDELTEYEMARALIRQGSDPTFLLPDWSECPWCEGSGKERFDDDGELVIFECWRCGGVGSLSPESLKIYKEKEMDDAKSRSDQKGS
jgi:hypothetical protein